jgi:hypothetical protein
MDLWNMAFLGMVPTALGWVYGINGMLLEKTEEGGVGFLLWNRR